MSPHHPIPIAAADNHPHVDENTNLSTELNGPEIGSEPEEDWKRDQERLLAYRPQMIDFYKKLTALKMQREAAEQDLKQGLDYISRLKEASQTLDVVDFEEWIKQRERLQSMLHLQVAIDVKLRLEAAIQHVHIYI